MRHTDGQLAARNNSGSKRPPQSKMDNAFSCDDLHTLIGKLIQRRKLEAAEELSFFLIKRNALDAEAFCAAGEIYRAKGDFTLATRMLNQALVIDPDNAKFQEALAKVRDDQDMAAAEKPAAPRATETDQYPAPGDYIKMRNILVAHKKDATLVQIFDRVPLLNVPDSARTEASLDLQRKGIERKIPAVLISGENRTGTVYIRNLIAKKLDIPVHFVTPNIGVSLEVVPSWIKQFASGGNVNCQHIYPEYLDRILDGGIKKIVVHGRNPKQWVVSRATILHRSIVLNRDPQDRAVFPEMAELSLSQTFDLHIERELPAMLQRWMAWIDIAETQSSALEVKFTRYEDMVADKQGFFRGIADFFGYEWTEILPDEDMPLDASLTNANYRKGQVDEWRSALTPAQIDRIDNLVPESLRAKFGW